MDLNAILLIVSGALAVIAAVAGGGLKKVKAKIAQFANLFKPVFELVDALLKALDDNTVTPEEIVVLKKEANDVKTAFFELIGKSLG